MPGESQKQKSLGITADTISEVREILSLPVNNGFVRDDSDEGSSCKIEMTRRRRVTSEVRGCAARAGFC
jgi:hypothetical protein